MNTDYKTIVVKSNSALTITVPLKLRIYAPQTTPIVKYIDTQYLNTIYAYLTVANLSGNKPIYKQGVVPQSQNDFRLQDSNILFDIQPLEAGEHKIAFSAFLKNAYFRCIIAITASDDDTTTDYTTDNLFIDAIGDANGDTPVVNPAIDLFEVTKQDENFLFSCAEKELVDLTIQQFGAFLFSQYDDLKGKYPILHYEDNLFLCNQLQKDASNNTLAFTFNAHDNINNTLTQYTFTGHYDGSDTTQCTITYAEEVVNDATDVFVWNGNTNAANARFSCEKRKLTNISLTAFCQYLAQHKERYNNHNFCIVRNVGNNHYLFYYPNIQFPIARITASTVNISFCNYESANKYTTRFRNLAIIGNNLETTPSCTVTESDKTYYIQQFYEVSGDPLTQTPLEIWGNNANWLAFARDSITDDNLAKEDTKYLNTILIIKNGDKRYIFKLDKFDFYRAPDTGAFDDRKTGSLTFTCQTQTDDGKAVNIALIYDQTTCPNGKFVINTLENAPRGMWQLIPNTTTPDDLTTATFFSEDRQLTLTAQQFIDDLIQNSTLYCHFPPVLLFGQDLSVIYFKPSTWNLTTDTDNHDYLLVTFAQFETIDTTDKQLSQNTITVLKEYDNATAQYNYVIEKTSKTIQEKTIPIIDLV